MKSVPKTMRLKAIVLASPHILCCGVLPFLGVFGAELFPWADRLWVKVLIAVSLTIVILYADDMWHKKSKEPHAGLCETLHGKKGTSYKKYLAWTVFAVSVTSLLHFLDGVFLHAHE